VTATVWPEVPLGEVASIERSGVAPEDIDPGTTYVGLEHMTSAGGFEGHRPVKSGELGSQKFRFTVGHVLYGKLRPYLSKIACPTFDGVCSTDIVPIRPHDRLDRRYLLRFLRQPIQVAKASALATGANLPRLSPKVLADFPIPLPALEEQRRIAAVLDAADELRAKRRESLALLDSLTESVFLDMFGDPVTNPMGWQRPTLGEVVASLQYGHRFYNESYSDEGVPIVRITDLNDAGDLDFSAMPRMAVSAEDRERFVLRPGVLLFARSGATVGKVALVRPGDPECIAGAYFITLTFGGEVIPSYAKAFLRSSYVRAQVLRQSRQAAQQNFSGPALRRLLMPVPPIGLQRRFDELVNALGQRKDTATSSAGELDALFASLQHRAFRGEL
jgi:type I restriction enzyme, S subunit